MIKFYLLIILCGSCIFYAKAQVPINDNCSNAIDLTPQLPCSLTIGNLQNATPSGMPKSSCDFASSPALKDVWYKFTASYTSHTITLFPSSGLDGVLSLYASCSGMELGCSDNGGGAGGIEKIQANNLTPGNVYYIRVYAYGSSVPSTTAFSLCIINPINSLASASVNCSKNYMTTIENRDVYKHNTSGFVMYRAKMAIDADGHPCAYGPNNSGLDYTANAGSPGNWWGVVTDANGNPIVQGANDPCPGMYVSTTSLVNSNYAISNPLRYVHSGNVPYYVIPSSLKTLGNIQLGDVAYVYNTQNGLGSFAIFADVGPSGSLGEGSMQLAQRLGINSNPKTGGISNPVIYYIIFPHSGFGQGKIPSNTQIDSIGNAHFYPAGGLSIIPCIDNLVTNIDDNVSSDIVHLFPNPLINNLLYGKINLPDNKKIHIQLNDIIGACVFNQEVVCQNNMFVLSLDNQLPAGIYIVNLKADTLTLRQKIMIQR